MVGSAIALITTTLARPIHNDFFMPNSFLNRVLLKWITHHAAGDIHQALGAGCPLQYGGRNSARTTTSGGKNDHSARALPDKGASQSEDRTPAW
jgi:hypothetical protein